MSKLFENKQRVDISVLLSEDWVLIFYKGRIYYFYQLVILLTTVNITFFVVFDNMHANLKQLIQRDENN